MRANLLNLILAEVPVEDLVSCCSNKKSRLSLAEAYAKYRSLKVLHELLLAIERLLCALEIVLRIIHLVSNYITIPATCSKEA